MDLFLTIVASAFALLLVVSVVGMLVVLMTPDPKRSKVRFGDETECAVTDSANTTDDEAVVGSVSGLSEVRQRVGAVEDSSGGELD